MDNEEYLVNRPDLGDRSEVQAGEFYPVVGVGPHPKPWPIGEQYDPQYLENGDKRNVLDKYRYWSVEAIVKDLDKSRHPLHIAIENWQHDLNIGSVVRTANAFNVAGVHIIGIYTFFTMPHLKNLVIGLKKIMCQLLVSTM
jgi:hypothetical protein